MDNKPCLFKKSVNCNQNFDEFIGRKTCFIACPSSDDITLELLTVKSVLNDEGIVPIVATDYDIYNEEMLCSKICKNIIGSSFCIAILTEVSPKNSQNYPENTTKLEANANVYFEYGIMTALYKNIIPIQRNGQKPKFDNQNLNLYIYDEITSTNAKQFKENMQEKIRGVKLDESYIGERQKRVLEGLDREIKNNFENCFYFRSSMNHINSESMWTMIYDKLGQCRHVFYDEFKKNYLTRMFDEKTEIKLMDAYEMLEQRKEKAHRCLETYRQKNYAPNSPEAYNMAERFRDQMEELYPKLKEAILAIKKDNESYIKSYGN